MLTALSVALLILFVCLSAFALRFDAFLEDFKSKKSEGLTIFLQGLQTCTKTQLSDDVTAITLGNRAKLPVSIEFGGEAIYERSFYDDLLKELRMINRCVLIGNPG
jgi:hypothetical protein